MNCESINTVVTSIQAFKDRAAAKDEMQLHRATVLKTSGPPFFSEICSNLESAIDLVNRQLRSDTKITYDKFEELFLFSLNSEVKCEVRLVIGRRHIIFKKNITTDDPEFRPTSSEMTFFLSVTRDDSVCAKESKTQKLFTSPELMSEYLILAAFDNL